MDRFVTGVRRFGAMFCVLIMLCFAVPLQAFAETQAERYQRLRAELEATRAQIDSYQNDLSAAEQLRIALEEEKALIDEMVDINRAEITRTQTELTAKEEQLAEKRAVIYENDQLLRQRLLAIHEMNTSNMLSQLLNVEDYSDFFVMMDALQRISQHDVELLDMLNAQRIELEQEQAEIDALLAELTTYHQQLLENQEALAQNIVDTDNHISYTQAQLQAQEEIEGEQYAALLQAQREMQAIGGSIGGSSQGDGSTYVGGVFVWPVPGYYTISCHYGSPDPNGSPHRGMDITGGSVLGADIVACGSGTVIVASYAHGSYGNYMIVDHGDGVKTLYAHCTSLLAQVGSYVSQGQTIATVGSTGFSTGPHLHLEVHAAGGLQNPANWLQG